MKINVERSSAQYSKNYFEWIPFILISSIWLYVFYIVQPEWEINEQYNYGYFVPFIGLYLIYLRWIDRPNTIIINKFYENSLYLFLVILVISIIPLQILYTANPDWRFVFWCFAFIALLISYSVLLIIGGKAWLSHFCFAIAIFMFAIPWPTFIEHSLIQQLMRFIASVTVEVTNLCGIRAIQEGNIIYLMNLPVGIEEACSGVRSLQSNLMASFFFSELFRLPNWIRFIFILSSILISILLNLIRTFTLTYAVYYGGADFMNKWHDIVGDFVAILGFIIILALAYLIKKLVDKFNKPNIQFEKNIQIERMSFKPNYFSGLLIIFCISFIINYTWYAIHEPKFIHEYQLEINWNYSTNTIHTIEIPNRTRAILRYSNGVQKNWIDANNLKWTAFHFEWESGLLSAFAGVHRPDVCLPSAGFKLEKEFDELKVWKNSHSIEIPFKTYIFNNENRNIFVFFSVIDELNAHSSMILTATTHDRIQQALKGKKIGKRRQIEFIIENAENNEVAWNAVKNFLNESIIIKPI